MIQQKVHTLCWMYFQILQRVLWPDHMLISWTAQCGCVPAMPASTTEQRNTQPWQAARGEKTCPGDYITHICLDFSYLVHARNSRTCKKLNLCQTSFFFLSYQHCHSSLFWQHFFDLYGVHFISNSLHQIHVESSVSCL